MATVAASATAIRVTLTAVPLIVNSHTGPVAGPRVVVIGAVTSVADTTSSAMQSLQVAPGSGDRPIAVRASWAPITRTGVVDPSAHVTVAVAAEGTVSPLSEVTSPAISARFALSPKASSQSPT